MNVSNPVFQRTDAGREEIHHKTHGLTQSERLVLILIDGITGAKDIRSSLRGVTEERCTRAFNKLLRNHLIQEVMMAASDQVAEVVDATISDNFLRQDALDPVTVISTDPDDEFPAGPPNTISDPYGSERITPASGADAHLWRVQPAEALDPFPTILTESRIGLPRDIAVPATTSQNIPETAIPADAPLVPPVASQSSFPPAWASHEKRSVADISGKSSSPNETNKVTGWPFWLALILSNVAVTIMILLY